MWEVRSTPKTTHPWTKTTKNSTNLQIQIRAIFGVIFGKNFMGEIGGGWGEIRGNSRLLIPYDVIQTTWGGPIFTNSHGEWGI